MMSRTSIAARSDRHFANEAAFERAPVVIPAAPTLRPKVDACLVSFRVVRFPSVEVSEFHRIRRVAFRLFCLHSPDKTRPTFGPPSSRIGPLSGCPQSNSIPVESSAFFQPLTCNPCTQSAYTSHRIGLSTVIRSYNKKYA